MTETRKKPPVRSYRKQSSLLAQDVILSAKTLSAPGKEEKRQCIIMTNIFGRSTFHAGKHRRWLTGPADGVLQRAHGNKAPTLWYAIDSSHGTLPSDRVLAVLLLVMRMNT